MGRSTWKTKSKVARCLDLPPRLLLNEAIKITNTPSPTTVKKEMRGGNKDMMMRSWRWESFKENNRGVVVKEKFNFSGPLSSTTSSAYDFDIHQRKVLRLIDVTGIVRSERQM
ncbi:hypothetical protein RND71_018161 [Anisodus tanguticus]|uniref:Uncharacterized protein n=1 Tax=Anisodus tanguticus TaxID=243964 RepID=A0AAE1VJW8_9SOLA|nr:hypothetical protein RND71_018161 [Anisodus tanguticus]